MTFIKWITFTVRHQTRPTRDFVNPCLTPRFPIESGGGMRRIRNTRKTTDLDFVQASDASAMALAATLAQKQLMAKMKGCSIGNRPLVSSLPFPSFLIWKTQFTDSASLVNGPGRPQTGNSRGNATPHVTGQKSVCSIRNKSDSRGTKTV